MSYKGVYRFFMDGSAVSRNRSVAFVDHDLGGFNHSDHAVAFFQLEFLGALSSNDGIDDILSDANRDVRHHVSHNDFSDLALELVPRADSHVLSYSFLAAYLLSSGYRLGMQLSYDSSKEVLAADDADDADGGAS
jgi:hypothetical protein